MRFWSCLIAVVGALSCEGQAIYGAKKISSAGNDYIAAHAFDPSGNKYLSVYVNPGQPLTIYGKTYALNYGNYILRFDPSDSLTFIYNLPHLGEVQAIAPDSQGNLFVASKLDFSFRYTKLGPLGNTVWQVVESIQASVRTKRILIDDQGNSYVGGTVESVFFFGRELYINRIYPYRDFLLKFSTSGAFQWMNMSDRSNHDVHVSAMRFDNQGNILIGGSFHTQVKMGSWTVTNSLGDNYSNMYMACVSPQGVLQWLKGFVGPGYFVLYDIEVDPAGDLYFTGGFWGTTSFGSIVCSTSPLGEPDFILGKLSSNFDVQWIKFKDAVYRNMGGYLANTADGIVVSGTAQDLEVDDLALPPSNQLQAFVARIKSDGTALWLKSFGKALTPGSYSDGNGFHFYKAGYQLTRIGDACHFISGNFVSTLDTEDGLWSAQSRDAFTGTLTESTDALVDLGPDVSAGICFDDSLVVQFAAAPGTNFFLPLEGTMPGVTFLSDAEVKFNNLTYGLTRFKWVNKNCTSFETKLITIHRKGADGPQPDTTRFCELQLSEAVVTVNGTDVKWYDDEFLTTLIGTGNALVPTASDTVYATAVFDGCVSKPNAIAISVIENPEPPTGQPNQVLEKGESIADLEVTGSNVKWYTDTGNLLYVTSPLTGGSTYYATQSVNGCESLPFAVKIAIVTSVEGSGVSLRYYPNPAREQVTISFDQPMSEVVLRNLMGQAILSKQPASSTVQLGLASVESGIYLVQVRSGERMMSFKFVKE
jgi:hypothetical protein